jgi:hypothetical protein
MTQTNESQPPPKPHTTQQQSQPSVSKKLVTLFNTLFTSAESKQNKELNQEPTKSTKQTKSNQKEQTPSSNKKEAYLKTFSLDPNELPNFFPELGIQSLAQVEHILINVTSHVQTATNTPHIPQQFIVQLNQFKNTQLEISISNQNNATCIQLNCTGELHQLLAHYLPELKKHLRKKSIDFDEILLSPTENLMESDKATSNITPGKPG